MTDKYIEKFGDLGTFLVAYMRDVTYTIHHSIQPLGSNAKMIGRAFTVKGPEIYFNALEAIPKHSIYVHSQGSDDHAVWSGVYAEVYGKPRGLIGAVIDGEIHDRKITEECQIPTFGRFVSPLAGINRQEGTIQTPVVCGGVLVCPGDIIIGDADGVVVIPKTNEEEIYGKVDGLIDGLSLFSKVARQPGIVVTEHEALGELVELKYKHPDDYWRCCESWADKWKEKYGEIVS